MKRRYLLVTLCVFLFPPLASGQRPAKARRIAVLMGGIQDPTWVEALRDSLKQLGWIDQHNVVIEYRWAEGDASLMRRYAAELVNGKPDVIVVRSATALREAGRAAGEIPIIFVSVSDPVGNGFVQSLARPGRNITGFSNLDYDMAGKWLQLLMEVAPHVKRVLVIGGGPAGMHAARILAEQGNRVSLFESASELGGQMRYSSKVATDYGYLVTYLKGQMKKLKVEVHLDSFVDLKTISDVSPGAVIVATGAGPGLRFCPWKDQLKTFNLFSALDRPDDDWEDRVVIIGGDSESCFLALYIAGRGAEVHVVEPKSVFSEDKMSPGRDLLMMALKNLPTVQLRPESTVEEVGRDYVLIQRNGEFETLQGVGSVVVGGRTANNRLYEQLVAEMPTLEVYNIGDSVEPRDLYYASHEAAEVAEIIRLRSLEGGSMPSRVSKA
jgi:thioredoxin reductase